MTVRLASVVGLVLAGGACGWRRASVDAGDGRGPAADAHAEIPATVADGREQHQGGDIGGVVYVPVLADPAVPGPAAPCEVRAAAAAASCGGQTGCAVLSEALLLAESGARDLRIAAAPAGTVAAAVSTIGTTPRLCVAGLADGAGAEVETDPVPGWAAENALAGLVVDGAGSLHLFGESTAGVSHLERVAGRWTATRAAAGGFAAHEVLGAAAAAGGPLWISYKGTDIVAGARAWQMRLAFRPPGGNWSDRTSIAVASADYPDEHGGALALDAAGRPVAVWWTSPGSALAARELWSFPGPGQPEKLLASATTPGSTHVAVPGAMLGARPVVSAGGAGVRVFVPSGSAGYREIAVPEATYTGCPDASAPLRGSVWWATAGGCKGHARERCTVSGAGSVWGSHALARTDDGAIWAAYSYEEVDRDVRLVEQCAGPVCPCYREIVVDRTVKELRLGRVPLGMDPGGIDVRLRVRLRVEPYQSGRDEIALAARGQTLALGIGARDFSTFRLLLVDTTRLR